MNSWIIVGLCLGVFVALAACGTGKGDTTNSRPGLPPRNDSEVITPTVIPATAAEPGSPKPLPPRYASAKMDASRNVTIQTNYGPRGIKPSQFPCCPYDKQRNVPGKPQVVFWDSGKNCYRCSKGHSFKRNGRII